MGLAALVVMFSALFLSFRWRILVYSHTLPTHRALYESLVLSRTSEVCYIYHLCALVEYSPSLSLFQFKVKQTLLKFDISFFS